MATLLLFPGEESAPVALQDFLRQVHDDARAAVDAEIARREASGVPLGETIDWASPDVHGPIEELEQAALAHNAARIRAVAGRLIDVVAGALAPLPPYQPNPDLDGIEVRFAVLDVEDQAKLFERERRARAAASEARARGADGDDVHALDLEVGEARKALLLKTVTEVRGLQGADGAPLVLRGPTLDDRALRALLRAGVFGPLFEAAVAYQGIPPGKALRSGHPDASTSKGSSSASDARSTPAPSSAASAAPPIPSSAAPNGKRAPAQGGTARTTPT